MSSKAKAKAKPAVNGRGDKSHLLDLYRQMFLIRKFEEACGEQYGKGHIRGFLHLYIGEEAIAVGSISALREDDYIVTGNAVEWISKAPREVAEIEAIMRQPYTGPAPRDRATVEAYRSTGLRAT